MIEYGPVLLMNVRPSAAEQAVWRTKPHGFLNEASKLSAKACSATQAAMIFRRRKCWWCKVVEGEHE